VAAALAAHWRYGHSLDGWWAASHGTGTGSEALHSAPSHPADPVPAPATASAGAAGVQAAVGAAQTAVAAGSSPGQLEAGHARFSAAYCAAATLVQAAAAGGNGRHLPAGLLASAQDAYRTAATAMVKHASAALADSEPLHTLPDDEAAGGRPPLGRAGDGADDAGRGNDGGLAGTEPSPVLPVIKEDTWLLGIEQAVSLPAPARPPEVMTPPGQPADAQQQQQQAVSSTAHERLLGRQQESWQAAKPCFWAPGAISLPQQQQPGGPALVSPLLLAARTVQVGSSDRHTQTGLRSVCGGRPPMTHPFTRPGLPHAHDYDPYAAHVLAGQLRWLRM
jgi:hypothetical protein